MKVLLLVMAIPFFIIVWILLGCFVLASMDDENQSILKWAKTAPFPIPGPIVAAFIWPYLVYLERRGEV